MYCIQYSINEKVRYYRDCEIKPKASAEGYPEQNNETHTCNLISTEHCCTCHSLYCTCDILMFCTSKIVQSQSFYQNYYKKNQLHVNYNQTLFNHSGYPVTVSHSISWALGPFSLLIFK